MHTATRAGWGTWGRALGLGSLVLLGAVLPAWAEDAPLPPPPAFEPVPVADEPPLPSHPPADAPPVDPPPAGDLPPLEGPLPEGPVDPVAEIVRPVETRERPPEPPPPGAAMPNWDLDHLNAEVTPPPLPPPDPYLLRPILLRHDIRTASADGRITPLRRIPQWVDVLERHHIEEWRPLGLGQLASRLPNVTMADGGNPFLQIPSIRGLGFDRVKILTDGVWPSTQALGSQGGTLSLWDPEATERVEIYRGPGVYLRAIDSPGGFINVVPRRPRQHGAFSADWKLRQSYASATNTWRSRAEVDVGEGRVAGLVGITRSWHDHRDTGGGTLNPSSYDEISADLALDYFLAPTSRIGLTVQFHEASDVDSPLQTGTVSRPNYQRVFVGLSLSSFHIGNIFHGNRISLSLDGFFDDDDTSITNQQAGIGGSDDVTRYDFHLEGKLDLCDCHDTWAELSVGYAHLKRTETLLCVPIPPGGFPKHRQEALEKVGLDPSTLADLSNCQPVTRDFEAEEFFVSALLEDQVHQDCFDLFAGARVDYFHAEDSRGQDDSRLLFAGAAGAAVHLNKRVSVYGNISYGRRRPTLFERGATEVVNGVILFGNQDLKPEIHGNAEVGLKASWRNWASFQAAGFVHLVDSTIAPVDLVGGVQQLENQGEVWLYGAELSGAIRPFRTVEGLEGFGSVGITRSTRESLIDDVPFQYRGGARYSVPAPKGYRVRRWFGELSFRGASSSRRGPLGDGAYVTGDVVLGTQMDLGRNRQLQVGLGVTNLFDRAYREATSQLRAPGRSFFWQFGLDI